MRKPQEYRARPTAAGHYEPSCELVFLPRCTKCGHKHPKAYMPPLDINTCPKCGANTSPPGGRQVVKAVLGGGIAVKFANACLAVGRALTRLSRGLDT